ncbi:hypothetical protein [Rhodococcus tukisamuensis]|uniref:Signal transduction histidine kinase n=1 Tax=Rhodococcus tukisamuensis TaxID=168276 RepID=A0A1G6SCJ4_9NOCA|nr:hypothetical protein [Rhodococcus tukisamuensis]SDD14612.1 hypothetical protein SAMN05444580_10393 [Rhodococcus tukisamuensis]
MTRGIGDPRELLGMRSPAATLIVWFYALTFALLAVVSHDGVSAFWPLPVAVLVVTCGAVALIRIDGDPLPIPATLVLAAIGPVSCALVLSVLAAPGSIPHQAQAWPLGASTVIYTFMCVRGRTWYAWLGFAATTGIFVAWSIQIGQSAGHGVTVSTINLPPLLMATFFAYKLRPDAQATFELREQTTRRVAAEAADSAMLEERDGQLRRLDELARPLLERIRTESDLNADERLACRLLEAYLRDTLRAPALADAPVSAAARAARTRGVEVILLDDRGMDTAPAEVRDRFLTAVADELDAARDGAVTVRVLPPGRKAAATVLANSGNAVRRIEFGPDGLPIQPVQEPSRLDSSRCP